MTDTKIIALVAAFSATLLFAGCRKEAPGLVSPETLRSTSYTAQFEAIWHGLDQSYLFWSYETVDWDSIYTVLHPCFEEFDSRGSVSDAELYNAYERMCGQLIDHHFSLQVRNRSNGHTIYVNPGYNEVSSRDYYHYNYINEQAALLEGMEGVSNYKSSTDYACHNWFALFPGKTSGKKIAYLRISDFNVSRTPAQGLVPFRAFYGNSDLSGVTDGAWAKNNQVEALILDVRGNGGGNADELIPILGSLTPSRTDYGYSRVKEGLGRLDYSAWVPFFLPTHKHHLDGSKPVVVLADVNSASCAEMAARFIQVFPHGTFIGERTFGATCPLLPGSFNLLYSGVFGDLNYNGFYVYTSNFVMVNSNYRTYEGVGITPDIECLFDYSALLAGHDNQLERALQYLRTGK